MKILEPGQYYGTRQTEVVTQGIRLSEYDYHAARTDWHYHENPYFMYVLRGDLYDINKKQQTLCSPGSLLLHNWQDMHYNELHTSPSPEVPRGFHLEFDKEWLAANSPALKLWEGSSAIQHPLAHHIIFRILYEFRTNDPFSQLSVEVLLVQLCDTLALATEAEDKAPAWIHKLKELIHHSQPEDLSLSSLSARLGIHPVHISRAVPRYLSATLGQYIRQVRISKALQLMLQAKHTYTEIAHICGFNDQSHFNRVFKSYFHLAPRQLRQKLSC